MIGILTIIFAVIFFLIIMSKAYLAALRPVSLAIIIIISLFLGYILAGIIAWALEFAIKIIPILAIVGVVIYLFAKK